MTVRTFFLGVFVVASLFPSSAIAQDRAGFWFGVGSGFGSAGVSCDDCGESDREGSGVAYFKGGWTVNRQTLVGAEFNLGPDRQYHVDRRGPEQEWSKDNTSAFNATVNLYNFSGTLTYYPQPAAGLFVKGGVGVAVAIIDLDVTGPGSGAILDSGSGLGVVVGAGYDMPVSRRTVVTPAVNFWYGRPGNLKVLGTTFASNWKQNVVDFTIGITLP